MKETHSSPSYCVPFEEFELLDRSLLGGKGASLVEMTHLDLPVPPGFTVTTDVWKEYEQANKSLPSHVWTVIEDHLHQLEQKTGRYLGDRENPLFVSVRSGAPISMPGILDTVLNIGINKQTVEALERTIGVKTAKDVRRSIPANFPEDPWAQIRVAIGEVFDSWNSPKAQMYRRKHGIPEVGTAATIQTMVWGNSMKDEAGSGVILTRDTQKFSNQPVVIFAPHAQGPAVVDKNSPYPQVSISELPIPKNIQKQLFEYAQFLEKHYQLVPQDVEFTYDGDRLWILQAREAPLSPLAHLRSILYRIEQGFLTTEEALRSLPPAHLHALFEPDFDPMALVEAEKNGKLLAEGLSVSIGGRIGRLIFSLEEAVNSRAKKHIVLADPALKSFSQLSPNIDAVLLDKAGVGSHIAREGTAISSDKNILAVFGVEIDKQYANHIVSVNGNTGKVYEGALPFVKDDHKQSLLSSKEYKTAKSWLSTKRENPWRFVGPEPKIKEYTTRIQHALSEAEWAGIKSLKAREITVLNAAIPREIRQQYTVVQMDTKESLVRTIRPILTRIFAGGNHATIRTCHTPELPASGPWALVRNMKDFDQFLVDEHYSTKYGGFDQFIAHPQLTELLVGDIPVGKMENDPSIQYQHCAWTLTCTEIGSIILQIHPHNPHLREHETAKKEKLVTFTTHYDPQSTTFLAQESMEIGDKLLNDELAEKFALIVKEAVFHKWWTPYELSQRLAAVTNVMGVNATFEGQATRQWCLGYGIKTR